MINIDRNKDFLEALFEGIYFVDQNRKILFWNKGAEHISGYKQQEVLNSNCYNNILNHIDKNGKHLCHDGCPLHDTLQTGKINEADVYLHHKDGHRVAVSIKSFPIKDEKGNITGAIETFTDKESESYSKRETTKLRKLLRQDELTGISNRRHLDFFINQKLKSYKTFNDKFGLLFFDIDHFKNVNDTYGHDVGDSILKMVAKTINQNTREADNFGRFGGEEFLLVAELDSEELLYKLAEKLRILVAESAFRFKNEKPINVTVSIGGSLVRKKDSVKSLIKRADTAMYQAKNNGRNQTKIN
ncbi:MAG: sensor domain-containing diguanylate cyclase [Candidatus Izimaplasma sp.]|nr:sensor domain-containing diguanylate cyclase [Candidatus Izimaplasma bacterium]